MDINTHKLINNKLCGKPISLKKNYSCVELKAVKEMAADDYGLVHGGFVFSAADYAAMLAVNHPNVVLGSSSVKFTKPVRVNEIIVLEAEVYEIRKNKHYVNVKARVNNKIVFEGDFICFILEKHILAK
jgi:acyl-coenzyme A thioesterase PaaI-like protein